MRWILSKDFMVRKEAYAILCIGFKKLDLHVLYLHVDMVKALCPPVFSLSWSLLRSRIS